MAESAPDNKQEFITTKPTSLKEWLKSIDSGVYKQILIFVGIAVVLATALYVFLLVTQELAVKEQTKVAAPQTQGEDKKNQEIKEKSSKDQTRKNDLYTINSALKSYFVANKKAPKDLEELVPDTLPNLPKDPETNGNYNYLPAEQLLTWTVEATLSNKQVFEVGGP